MAAGGLVPSKTKKFEYGKLTGNQIRLLKLNPLRPLSKALDDTLTGELITSTIDIDDENNETIASIHDIEPDWSERSLEINGSTLLDGGDSQNNSARPRFEALSYVWGGDDPEAKAGRPFLYILLAGQQGPDSVQQAFHMSITPNLEAALKTFRSKMKPDDELYLWADAICINQENHEERSDQIHKIADIYTKAERVRIWLGEDDENSRGQAAFDFIRQILTFNGFDDLVKKPIAHTQWDNFQALMQNGWFKRRWIVQEICFANDARVYLGKSEIPWKDMKGAISLFVSVSDPLRQMFQKAPEFHNTPDHLGEIKAFGAKTLVDVTKRMFRKSTQGYIMEHLLSLESLLTTLTPFDATVPHDSVYAIMRLSNDARPGPNSKPGTRGRSRTLGSFRITENARLGHQSGKVAKGSELHSAPVSPVNTTFLSSGSDASVTTRHMHAVQPSRKNLEANLALERGRLPTRLDASTRTARSRSPANAKKEYQGKNRKPPTVFAVDYDRSFTSLRNDIYNFIVEKSRSIDIICKPWVPKPDPNDIKTKPEDKIAMPSWVQPLTKRPYGIRPRDTRYAHQFSTPPKQKYERLAADTLVGTSAFGLKPYDASGGTPIPDEFVPGGETKGVLIQDRIFNARGFILDVIKKTTDPAPNATIPKSWPKFGRWRNRQQDPPLQFWTTLVANRKSSEGPEQPPDHWLHACRWAFDQGHVEGNLVVSDILAGVHDKPSEQVLPFLHRMREVIWDRRLCWTKGLRKQRARLGLVPNEAKVGDKICILYGCSVPVLLRSKARSGSQRETSRSRSSLRANTRKRGLGLDASTSPNKRARSGQRPSSVNTDVNGHANVNANTNIDFATNVDTNTNPNSNNNAISSQNAATSTDTETTPAISITQFDQTTSAAMMSSSMPSSNINPSPNLRALPVPRSEVYTLIGECYIDGMMDGEAFHQLKWWDLDEQNFRIGCIEDCDCDNCSQEDAMDD